MSNELQKHKTADAVKWILTLLAFILIGVLLAGILCGWFDKKEETPAEDAEQAYVTDGDGNDMGGGEVYAMPKAMTFTSAALLSATSSNASVDVQIEAVVSPASAANKLVDYSVAWGTGASRASENVGNYLTVTQDSDGSTSATVSCKKAFGSDKIIITVTTRDGGYTATCTVSFVGVASGMTVTSSSATLASSASRGSYYSLATNKTYTFDINLSNIYDSVGSSKLSATVGASGSLYFGDGFCDPNSGITKISNIQLIELSSLADKFIKSAAISGNTLTVTTGKYEVEGYCDVNDYYTDEYDNVFYRNCYLYEDEWGLVGPAYTSDQSKCADNEEWVKSCYFTVTVTDGVSGLSETVKLWLDGVSGVSLSNSSLSF